MGHPDNRIPLLASGHRRYSEKELILGAGQVVISVAKEMNKTTRAVIAGLNRFFPKPPNRPLIIIIAIKQPIMAMYIGKLAGMLNEIRSPVRAAERSFIG